MDFGCLGTGWGGALVVGAVLGGALVVGADESLSVRWSFFCYGFLLSSWC